MKHTIRLRLLIHSLSALFGTNKSVNAHKLYPDKYYRNIYFTKRLYDGIAPVAKIDRINKKQAAELLITAGISRYIGAKIAKHIQDERSTRELNQKTKMTHFVMILRRYAREHGMDISKII